jgi:hypothetical protein
MENMVLVLSASGKRTWNASDILSRLSAKEVAGKLSGPVHDIPFSRVLQLNQTLPVAASPVATISRFYRKDFTLACTT